MNVTKQLLCICILKIDNSIIRTRNIILPIVITNCNNKRINKSMIIKQPSKRISHLNLKFLDLRFMSLSVEKQKQPKRIDSFSKQQKDKYNTGVYPSTLASSIANVDKKNTSVEQDTVDITVLNNPNTYIHSNSVTQNNSHIRHNTSAEQSITNYLTVDSNALYQELSLENQNKIKAGQQNSANYKQYSKQNINRQIQSIRDDKMLKYVRDIETIKRQNELIHKQIGKMFSQNINKNVKCKHLSSSMKIFENLGGMNSKRQLVYGQPGIANKNVGMNNDMIRKDSQCSSTRYATRNKADQYNDPIIQKPSLKDPHLKRRNYTTDVTTIATNMINQQKCTNTRSNKARLILPQLINNKYQYFYENLYSSKQRSSHSKEKNYGYNKKKNDTVDCAMEDGEYYSLVNKINSSSGYANMYNADIENHQENLLQAKKRLISNNFDRSFEEYLTDNKMRVPQILKNIR